MKRRIIGRKGWFGVILSLALCLSLVCSAVAPALAADAREGCEDCLSYPIMQPDRETLERWIEAYNNAPKVHIDREGVEVPSPRGSLSLLDHLEYTPSERNQGSCGNCWAWAGTGCLGIALHVQEEVKDRLSVQYINSCEWDVIGKACCAGGWLSEFADFYDPSSEGVGQCIPWANDNADWQSGDGSCGPDCGSISTDPNYPITAIQETTIVTQTVSQATAIANIKDVLNQDKAVWFAFFLPTSDAWDDFRAFWNTGAESGVYDMDQFCGIPYDNSPHEGGGHAVLCVGYNDDDPDNSYWIMLNSWGTTAGRLNGLFRINMDKNYSCTNSGLGGGDYSFYWQTLDVTFDIAGQPDITVSPTSFEVTLPPDTTHDYTLTVGNDGDADLTYAITDEETTGTTTPAPAGEVMPNSPTEQNTKGPNDILVQIPSASEPASLQRSFDAGYDDALKYDDGIADQVIRWVEGGEASLAVRFTPLSYPSSLQTVWIHLDSGTHAQFMIEVWDDAGADGYPGTILGSTTTTATNWGWSSIDISGMGIIIPSGDFYVAYLQMADSPNCEFISVDLTDCASRSWVYDIDWAVWYPAEDYFHSWDPNWMIRCQVDDVGDCPWLDENPKSGSVPAGGNNDITVTINTAGLTVGNIYTAEIVIANNDPDENPTSVAVALTVVDTTPPVITLLGDNPMTVQCGDPYVEPGATASDSCCITDPVAIGGDIVDTGTVGTYYVTYDVSDCAGNPAVQVIRTVNVVDTTAPTITLIGDNPMTVECGDPYVEPGATASDDCCITAPIIIGSDVVDTGTPGTYYVTYDVSDCAGNPAVQVVRTVNVVDITAPTITLLGDNPMTVQCGDPYVEPGATASDDCCITDPVTIGGDIVDTGTVGTCYVTYDVSDCAGNPAVQVVRTVNVEPTEEVEIQLSLQAGWNMVSVPVTPIDNSTSAVFPGVAAIFTWNATSRSYYVPTIIDPEKGYWVAVTENTTIAISGIPVETWTTDIKAGWNMIGSVIIVASIAAPNDDPDGSVITPAYWWDPVGKSYIPTTDIEPGKGYWVASVNDCTLTL